MLGFTVAALQLVGFTVVVLVSHHRLSREVAEDRRSAQLECRLQRLLAHLD